MWYLSPLIQSYKDWDRLSSAAQADTVLRTFSSLNPIGMLGNAYANSGKLNFNTSDLNVGELPSDIAAVWNSMSEPEKRALMNKYYETDNGLGNLWGLFGDRKVVDVDTLLMDLQNSGQMLQDYADLGDAPELESYLNSARADAAELYSGMYDDLAELEANRRDQYDTEMRNISDDYSSARSQLLSQNYRQNAQLMDTMQSNMDRARRNALEAGATAGVRIANNVNTLLSTQNQQSNASMDTANQLAQMMISRRNAEADANRSYSDYMAQSTANRHGLQREQESYAQNIANTNYTAAKDSYDTKKQNLDSAYGTSNSLYDNRHTLSKYYGGK